MSPPALSSSSLDSNFPTVSSFFTAKVLPGSSHDARALLLTSLAMVSYAEGVKLLATRNICASTTARKLMHIGCGPIFLLCWPLFSSLPSASYFAAGAPLALTSFFTIVGLGIIVNPATVKSMSRTGARQELLRGPLFYGSVMIIATLLFWRRLTAALCISCLCAGDGFADVVGRKFAPAVPSYGFEKKQDDVLRRQKPLGRGRIPWCPSKSWIGTVGFIVASSFTSACFVLYSSRQGWTIDDGGRHGRKGMERVWRRVWGSTLLSAAAESLPVPEGWDNLMVFGAALLADWLVMRGARTSV